MHPGLLRLSTMSHKILWLKVLWLLKRYGNPEQYVTQMPQGMDSIWADVALFI
jgi:hypothetical protein